MGILLLLTAMIACERDFDIEVKANKQQLIVEGYINNVLPLYNYVVLSRSQGYYATDLQNIPVTGATVSITEGVLLQNNTYAWDTINRTFLKEVQIPQLPAGAARGFYFDPKVVNDSTHALRGKPGKYYRLDIDAEGKHYFSITAMLPLITVDSITSGFYYEDMEDSVKVTKARLTVHYLDPDTVGNTQLYYWRYAGNKSNFGWGGLGTNRFVSGTDDLVNGQYINLTHPFGFVLSDSVSYYMASVERKVYNFWDSYNKARNNGGPFATPVKLLNTIQGEDVIGCFSGFSMVAREIVVQ